MRIAIDGVVCPAPMPPGVALDKSVPVSMRGIGLAVDVYKPAGMQGPWPATLAYSPFRKERSLESAKLAFYCPNGYVCVQATTWDASSRHIMT